MLNIFVPWGASVFSTEEHLPDLPFPEIIRDKRFWDSGGFDFRLKYSSKQWNLVSGRGFDQHFSLTDSQMPVLLGLRPFNWDVWFDSKTSKPAEIRINFWNKGDAPAHPGTSVLEVQTVLQAFIEKMMKNRSVRVEKVNLQRNTHIRSRGTMIYFESGNWFFELEKEEYMTLRIFPPALPQSPAPSVKMKSLKRQNEQTVLNLGKNLQKRANGDCVIFGIPMINQGKKGYCAPASCARVLQYYEYPVDEHQLAKMMGTNALSGTSYKTLKDSLKKISMTSPFYLKEIKFTLPVLQEYIERGIPVFWGIRYPAHLRLVIGINLRERRVIYSDSWGDDGIESSMSFEKAKALTSYAAVLK